MAKTHPWISFRFDSSHLGTKAWVTLGECVSKIEHIVETPLMPRFAEEMRMAFVSKGIQGTAAIEGNTLDVKEVRQRLQHELDLPPSQEYLGVEIDNLNEAFGLLEDVVSHDSPPSLDEERIKAYNRIILADLELPKDVVPGEYASKQHGVPGYRAPAPRDIRRLMPRFIDWINDPAEWNSSGELPALAVTILRAMLAHLYVAWIHPFGDGNGRTARLVEADILARGGVPIVCYHLPSDHYNRTRTAYYRRLAATSQRDRGSPERFVDYAIQGFAEGLREQIKQVKEQHREVVWRDFVYDHFRGKDSKRYQRLRRLAMDLAHHTEPVPKSEIPAASARMLTMYQGKTVKTVSRDMNELTERGLIVRTKKGYRAKLELLDVFVPPRRELPFEE